MRNREKTNSTAVLPLEQALRNVDRSEWSRLLLQHLMIMGLKERLRGFLSVLDNEDNHPLRGEGLRLAESLSACFDKVGIPDESPVAKKAKISSPAALMVALCQTAEKLTLLKREASEDESAVARVVLKHFANNAGMPAELPVNDAKVFAKAVEAWRRKHVNKREAKLDRWGAFAKVATAVEKSLTELPDRFGVKTPELKEPQKAWERWRKENDLSEELNDDGFRIWFVGSSSDEPPAEKQRMTALAWKALVAKFNALPTADRKIPKFCREHRIKESTFRDHLKSPNSRPKRLKSRRKTK